MSDPKKYVPKRQIAEQWHVSERTIDRLIATGELSAYRVGARSVRLDAAEVERVLTSRTVATADGPA